MRRRLRGRTGREHRRRQPAARLGRLGVQRVRGAVDERAEPARDHAVEHGAHASRRHAAERDREPRAHAEVEPPVADLRPPLIALGGQPLGRREQARRQGLGVVSHLRGGAAGASAEARDDDGGSGAVHRRVTVQEAVGIR